MAHNDMSNTRHNAGRSDPIASLSVLSLTGPIVFALAWMGFALYAFFQIHAWGVEYDRKMAMIERGEVKADTLYVTIVAEDKNDSGWQVGLGKDKKSSEWRSVNKIGDLRVGDTVTAYRFDDAYLIPRCDRGGHHWGKWIFFVAGLVPMSLIGGILWLKKLRER